MYTASWRHWENLKCFTLHFCSNYIEAKFDLCEPPAGHNLPFPSTIVISPLLAGPLTAKVLMHTLPRSVILRASAQVLCCWHFVNLSPRQRQLEQSLCSGLMEGQCKLCSRVTLWWLSIHHSRESFKGHGVHRDNQRSNYYISPTLETLCLIAIITRLSWFQLLNSKSLTFSSLFVTQLTSKQDQFHQALLCQQTFSTDILFQQRIRLISWHQK